MDSTMTICDSVATCVNKTAEICQHCVKETETNCLDVAIVFIICVAIAVVAIYAIRRYFKWKDDERTALANAAQQKRSNDEADRKLKQEADIEARKQNKEDYEQKKNEEKQAHELKRKEDKIDDLLKRKEELENRMHGYMESQIKNGESLSIDDMYIAELTKEIDEIKSTLNDKEA